MELAADREEPVEVLSLRDETSEVFATPQGTLEAREYVVPKWTRVEGSWAEVDLALEEREDGTIGPAASTVDLAFSSGGEGPLVTAERDGRELGLSWPGELPAPVIEEDRLTYRDVLPDVDLRMEVIPDGFLSLLIVRSAEAAQNPALTDIDLELSTQALEVQVTEEGGIEAVDEHARGVVFAAPTPLMWDSSVPGADGGQARTDSGVSPRPDEMGEEPGEPGPAQSAKLAALGVAVEDDGTRLRLTPDTDVLTGEDTQYPVYIDPQWHTPRSSARTFVSRHWPSSPQWNFNGRSDAGLGTCVGWAGCNANELKRLLYRIDTSRFAGTRVLSAEFTVRNTHSAQCTNHPVELWRTQGISASTTWNTQLASGFWIQRLATSSFHYGGNPDLGCRPAGDAEFAIRAAVQEAADKNWSSMTFGLRAGNESSNLQWKRFANNAHLRVEYNRPPQQIRTSQLTMEYGGTCKTQSNAARVRTLGSISAANVTDPDGDRVSVQFRVRWSGGSWNPARTSSKASGSAFSVALPSSIPTDQPIRWDVRAHDGVAYGPWSSVGSANDCHFVYDTTVPSAPQIVSGQYPESDPADEDDPWHTGVGHYGDFFLSAADNDVNRYRYGVNTDPQPGQELTTTGGAPQPAKVLPEQPGLHFVTAQALDEAGNISEVRTYQFRVGAGDGAVATWPMEDAAGATQADVVVPERPASAHGDITFGVDGAVSTAAHFDGESGYLATGEPILNTGRSFTVSAWVKLDRKPDRAAIAVNQAGIHRPGFELYYSATQDSWAFNQYRNDDPDDTRTSRVLADTDVTTGEWTHLVGSHDPANQRLRLFVNGELAGEAAHTDAWNARGNVQIGAGQHNGEISHHFPGAVDEVQIFSHVMRSPNTQIAQLYNKERIHHSPGRPALALFDLDEPAGATEASGARDALPALFEGSPQPGAVGPASNTAVHFNGEDDYARTTAGHLNTGRNFAVSAWAKLDKAQTTSAAVIATQTASHKPGFELYYSRAADRWAFNQYAANEPDASPVRAVQPAGTSAQDGEWVHLLGVHDTHRQTLTLYVNGLKSGETTLLDPFHANQHIQIGAGSYSGEVSTHFPGDISDVRLYDRVVTAYEAAHLYHEAPQITARWQFDTTTETNTTPDSSPNGNALRLSSGAEVGSGLIDEGALVLDGLAAHAATNIVPVDTSSSYTIAGWARAAGAPGEPVSLVSAAGHHQSAFEVRFVPHEEDPSRGQWQAVFADSDHADAGTIRVTNPLTHDARRWTHVALVYDAFTKRADLYVNGALTEVICSPDAGEECLPGTSWQEDVFTFPAEESLQVGRTWTENGWGGYWPGGVDDLWIFQGPLNSRQVVQLAEGESGRPTEVPSR